jgi:pSer/pThr/pTyr-binding forkhead associated (FHA) protein
MAEGHDVLVGIEGPLAGQRWVVSEAGLRVGREPTNEVYVPDQNVSRQHARVVLYKGVAWVQDAGSRNGVFVNNERVPDQRQLVEGDRIVLGPHVFEVVRESAAARVMGAGAARPVSSGRGRDLARYWPVLLVLGLGLAVLATAVWLRDSGSAEVEESR